MSHRCSRNFWDRREFLFTSGGGISGLALAYLLGRDDLLAAASPIRVPRRPLASIRSRRSRRITRRGPPP